MNAQFERDHYKYYGDSSPSPLTDANHMHLFHFLDYDLTPIGLLLDQYLTQQFDFTHMRLKEDRPAVEYTSEYEQALQTNEIIDLTEYEVPNPYIQDILSILADCHPFYTMGRNAEKEAEAIIADGFHRKASASESVMGKEEYRDFLVALLTVPPFPPSGFRSDFLGESKIDIETYYKDYLETYSKFSTVRRMKQKGIPVPLPSLGILETQSRLQALLIELLDNSESATKHRPQKEAYRFFIHLSVVVIDGVLYEEYSIENLRQLLECELYYMAQEKIKIKRCKCCNAYFVCSDNRQKYCDRMRKGKKTCREIGPNQAYWNQQKKDAKYKAFRKASSKNSMRLARGSITGDQFQYWREQAEEKRKSDSDDYYEWLDLTIAELRKAYKNKS